MSETLGNNVDPSLPVGSNNGVGGQPRRKNDYFVFNQHAHDQTGARTMDGNGYAREEVSAYELTDTQKSILLNCGFDRDALDKMRFPSHKEAYDWCGEQMRSPRKRRFAEPRGETSDTTPRKRIPLTRAQKWLLSMCGRSQRELDEMRFDSVQEGYRWVGDVSYAYLMPCEHDPYAYEEEEWDDEYDDELADRTDESYSSHSSENESSLESGDSQGRTVSLEDESIVTKEQNAAPELVATSAGGSKLVELARDGNVEGTNTPVDVKHENAGEQPLCGICFEPMGKNTNRHMAAGNCGHVYCSDCLTLTVKALKKCPGCNKRMSVRSIRNIYLDT